ncbi:MAG: hypothetical protein RMK17_00575 [bacterium]|nr:hypothetical protein [bacterium]
MFYKNYYKFIFITFLFFSIFNIFINNNVFALNCNYPVCSFNISGYDMCRDPNNKRNIAIGEYSCYTGSFECSCQSGYTPSCVFNREISPDCSGCEECNNPVIRCKLTKCPMSGGEECKCNPINNPPPSSTTCTENGQTFNVGQSTNCTVISNQNACGQTNQCTGQKNLSK